MSSPRRVKNERKSGEPRKNLHGPGSSEMRSSGSFPGPRRDKENRKRPGRRVRYYRRRTYIRIRQDFVTTFASPAAAGDALLPTTFSAAGRPVKTRLGITRAVPREVAYAATSRDGFDFVLRSDAVFLRPRPTRFDVRVPRTVAARQSLR